MNLSKNKSSIGRVTKMQDKNNLYYSFSHFDQSIKQTKEFVNKAAEPTRKQIMKLIEAAFNYQRPNQRKGRFRIFWKGYKKTMTNFKTEAGWLKGELTSPNYINQISAAFIL